MNTGIIRIDDYFPNEQNMEENQLWSYLTSQEIVEAYHQFLKLDSKCQWVIYMFLKDRFQDLCSSSWTRDIVGDNENFYKEILDWEVSYEELSKIDKDVARVCKSFRSLYDSSLVLRNEPMMSSRNTPFSGLRLLDKYENAPNERMIRFSVSRNAFKFLVGFPDKYTGKSVCFDFKVLNYLNRHNASRFLYLLACKPESYAAGYFQLKVEEIRLALHLDEVKDPDSLHGKGITDIAQFDIEVKKGYTRFSDFYAKTVEKALEEILCAFKKGICPFWLKTEVLEIKIYSGFRGAPRKGHAIKFIRMTEQPSEEVIHLTENNIGEFIKTPRRSHKPTKTDPKQLKLSFAMTVTPEQEKAIATISEKLRTIMDASGEKHTDEYIEEMVEQMKERIGINPDLLNCIQAWIKYDETEVQRENKDAKDLSCLVQSHLRHKCYMRFRGKTYQGTGQIVWPPRFWKDTVEEEVMELKNNRKSLDEIRHEYALDEQQLTSYVDKFAAFISSRNKFHPSLEKLMEHFEAWLKSQKGFPKEKVNKNNEQTITDNKNGETNIIKRYEPSCRDQRFSEYEAAFEAVDKMPRIVKYK